MEGKSCCRCDAPATNRKQKTFYCEKHFRFLKMRGAASYSRKIVPTWEQLDQMLASLDEMKCPHCKRAMTMRSGDDRSSVLTLQHYRSGELGFLCFSCNVRHGQYAGDSFMQMPLGHKTCPRCKILKPYDGFYRAWTSKKFDNRTTYCKACAQLRKREWKANVASKKRLLNGSVL